MIIVNQDKTVIINFDKVSHIYVQKNCIEYQCPYIEDFCGVLGFYKTEERAKEILQEITKAVSVDQLVNRSISQNELELLIKMLPYNVYEMPEE